MQNLITRHRGLEPTLFPRPVSRYESANTVNPAVDVEERYQSAIPTEHYRSTDQIRAESRHESRSYSAEPGAMEQSTRVAPPPFAGEVVGEIRSESDHHAFQDSADHSPRFVSRQDSEPPLAPGLDEAEKRAVEKTVAAASPTDEADSKVVVNQFDISELAKLLDSEQPGEMAAASPLIHESDASVRDRPASGEEGRQVIPDSGNRNLNYQDLADSVLNIQNELAAEKARSDTQTPARPRLATETRSTTEQKLLYAPVERPAMHVESKLSQAESQQEPVINVTIGRIEVRAVRQAETIGRKRKQAASMMSLDDYLRTRGAGKS